MGGTTSSSFDLNQEEIFPEHQEVPLLLDSPEFRLGEPRGSRTDFVDKLSKSEEGRYTTQQGIAVFTWNIGGGSEEKCRDFLPGLVQSHGKLKWMQFVLIQEATQKNTVAIPIALKDWSLALYKSDQEWRGQGILVRKHWGTLRQLQGSPGALSAVVGKHQDRLGIASLHLPPKATIEETESLLAAWGKMPAMQQQRLIVPAQRPTTF